MVLDIAIRIISHHIRSKRKQPPAIKKSQQRFQRTTFFFLRCVYPCREALSFIPPDGEFSLASVPHCFTSQAMLSTTSPKEHQDVREEMLLESLGVSDKHSKSLKRLGRSSLRVRVSVEDSLPEQ